MKKYSLTFLLFLMFASSSFAAPYDHIHQTATNALEAVNWYVKHFGGEPARFLRSTDTNLPIDRVMYGNIAIIFFEREPTAGSVGSSVDHISFSVSNVDELVAEVVADGGTQLGDLVEFSGMRLGFVEDPWGTKIELIDDSNLRGVHHLHLSSPNPESTLEWYSDNFGGSLEQFAGVLPGLNYGDIWLIVAQARGEVAATQGRSIDHLGWRYEDLTAGADALKANGVEFTMEPRDFRNIRISFVEGPDGVRIELVETAK
ncbi:MAG: VOC family protein [Gammaproteobacteria bacterium]|jgi:catechol 2,3-dioxygenase-like lactoylglutathione lyase family enzyme|nr:VOC family protein [Gammaproteobacteria bacterium]MBT3860277.1 VOC family protein [Gammaproteobacteria bacterium]MBT3987569.1 VOC family protein [Gammaproteobacteria bacterium]MBT4257129.1 VOC family protein [Gammaproteobacteria bacterium]MBT4581693.1 VOC family protein [Gammaproteobacteria bacterium]